MMAPPVATGSVDRDDESVGMSSRGRQVLSDRGQGREVNQNAPPSQNGAGGQQDFKKAYLAVSEERLTHSPLYLVKYTIIDVSFRFLLFLVQLVEDLAMKQADGEGEGQIAVTEDELKELNHQVSLRKYLCNEQISISTFINHDSYSCHI